MTEMSNTRIDRYEIRERVGSGGMARVYKAWDTVLERLVAVKILHDHLADDPSFKERFEREAKIVAGFDHPNIVRIYDYSVVDRDGYPLYYMVMSYISGKTLRRLLEESSTAGELLSQQRMLAIIENIADALGYAHARGMVHRDVKPGNILLNEQGQAILTDFGIARLAEGSRLTQEGVSTGTPAYMSPEQAAGERGDSRSDLYSLGVIVFEMLTGKMPYPDGGSLSVMLKHINHPVPLVSAVTGKSNSKLDLFILKALAKSPDERFQSAWEFLGALKRVYREDIVTAEVFALEPQADTPTSVLTSPVSEFIESPAPALVSQTMRTSTSVFQTISQVAKNNPRASSSFFTVVILIIGVLLGAFVINQMRDTPSSSTSEESVAEGTASDSSSVASMTGDFYFDTDFESDDETNQYWQQTEEGSFTQRIQDGTYYLENQVPGTAVTSIFSGSSTYHNVSITLDGTLAEQSSSTSAYGIVFRYQDEDNYNVFAIDGEGRYSIWARTDGVWNELRDLGEEWTANEAVQVIGEPNRVALEIIGDRFTGYVNNRRVVRLNDSTFGDGAIGIYLGASPDGVSVVELDSFRAFQSVPSMTAPN
jgi:serine/threonine protein kinase